MTDLDDLLELATIVAEEAGRLLLDYSSRSGLGVSTKSSATDPVSDADEASERLITERLLADRPDDGIVGEEDADNRPGTSGIDWVIDPLDGTVNFLYGIPQWCVSIAAEDPDGVLVGVVHDPNRRETFRARRGEGADLDGTALRVSERDDLDATLVATGFAYDPALRAAQGEAVADLLRRVRDVRRAGAAALDLAWLAAGRFDAYYEFGLHRWDWAAGDLLVREAGGVTSTVEQRLAGEIRTGLVAGGPRAHDHLRRWLEGHT